jgi:hypothetical protein
LIFPSKLISKCCELAIDWDRVKGFSGKPKPIWGEEILIIKYKSQSQLFDPFRQSYSRRRSNIHFIRVRQIGGRIQKVTH